MWTICKLTKHSVMSDGSNLQYSTNLEILLCKTKNNDPKCRFELQIWKNVCLKHSASTVFVSMEVAIVGAVEALVVLLPLWILMDGKKYMFLCAFSKNTHTEDSKTKEGSWRWKWFVYFCFCFFFFPPGIHSALFLFPAVLHGSQNRGNMSDLEMTDTLQISTIFQSRVGFPSALYFK